ncbi:MAG: hypothetical protein U1E76_21705 [Planctomycetota bacterium]
MTAMKPRFAQASFESCFAAELPALLVWAELHLPRSARELISREDVIVEVWRRARASWPLPDGKLRAHLFELANAAFTEITDLIKRELLFRGGTPESLRAVRFLEPATDVREVIRRALASPELQALLDQVEHLDAEDRHVLLYRGIERLRPRAAARFARVAPAELSERWRQLKRRFASWRDLLDGNGNHEADASGSQ